AVRDCSAQVQADRTAQPRSSASIERLRESRAKLQVGRKIMAKINLAILSALTGLVLASPSGIAVAQQNALKEQLVGAWRLVSAVVDKDGQKVEPLGPNPRGAVLFVASGYFSWNM